MESNPTVAVVQTRPETVLADYARLLHLAGITGAGDQPLHLLTAPSRRRPGPAQACPPWQLEGVARALLAAGRQPHDLALSVPPATPRDHEPLPTWRRVLTGCGIDDPLAEPTSDVSTLVLAMVQAHPRLGLPGTVGALAAAWLASADRAELSTNAEPLVSAWRQRSSGLAGAVLDATVCGDGSGGRSSDPVAVHLLLAGRDPIAVDVVAARLVGFDPTKLPLQTALAAAGIGCADPTSVTLVGDTATLPASLELASARTFGGSRGVALGPRWWRRWRDRLAEARPRPLAARRAQRRYESQPWGRLHREYDRRGVIGGGEA